MPLVVALPQPTVDWAEYLLGGGASFLQGHVVRCAMLVYGARCSVLRVPAGTDWLLYAPGLGLISIAAKQNKNKLEKISFLKPKQNQIQNAKKKPKQESTILTI